MRRKIMDELVEWKESGRRVCPIIRGARQVGKTYIVSEFAKEHYRSFVYFDLSNDLLARTAFDGDRTVDSIVMKLSSMRETDRFIPHETLIFLDEIQDCPNARASLKSFAVDGRYDVIASGSLLGLRKYDVPSYPVGYEEIHEMHPMDFEEFVWALGMGERVLEHVKSCIRARKPIGDEVLGILTEYTKWYMIVGGMPEAVLEFVKQRKFDGVRRIHKKIMQDYINDIAKHAERNQRTNINGCFESISIQLGRDNKRFRYSDVEKGGSGTAGRRDYSYALNWLEEAGISTPCFRVSNPVMPIEESYKGNLFKLYLFDTGLLLSKYSPPVRTAILNGDTDVNKGAVAENLVAQMIASQDRPLYYYAREKDDEGKKDCLEVDFLLSTENGVVAIEVKSGNNRDHRSLNKIMGEYGTGGLMLETRDIFVDDRDIIHMPLFAAAFLDCIYPPDDREADFGLTEKLNSMFERDFSPSSRSSSP